jgi:transmembrane sensor
MDQSETGQAIADRATEWVARIDAGPLDAATQAGLDAWLASDDRHRGAFFRATVVWRMLDRAGALAGGEQSYRPPIEDERPVVPSRTIVGRRGLLWGGGAIAASLVAAMLGRQMLFRAEPDLIRTAVGEIRKVPLGDRSTATVNTATTLQVDFGPERRDVRLDSGEAWFEVAKDATRPFVVAAGEVRVRAVGTAFSVHRLADGADVQVTEGIVDVWVDGRENDRVRVAAGARTSVTQAEGPRPAVADLVGIDRKLAWRDGALKFEGDTLGAAAAEFNRYNRLKLVVDPGLADEKIVGRFRIDEPAAFARATSTMLDARVHTDDQTIRIARQ